MTVYESIVLQTYVTTLFPIIRHQINVETSVRGKYISIRKITRIHISVQEVISLSAVNWVVFST